MTDYDDYYDAAKKDREPVILGEHGGSIYTQWFHELPVYPSQREPKREFVECGAPTQWGAL